MTMFVRVRDTSTGHEFDVPETDHRIGTAFKLLNRRTYPPADHVRRPKHRKPKTTTIHQPLED
jgi:hypothetical protein